LKNRFIALTVFMLLFLFLIGLTQKTNVKAENFPEYQKYVHTYLNSQVRGNWTYMEKPLFPVFFNTSQIGIGQNWSIVCPLKANHSYHVYCYGEWIDWDSEPITDYDIYVYDPFSKLETYHTESAGFPEHLGTTVNDSFFIPKYSGNYTFVLRNDPRESKGAQQSTFMIIENGECNVWHEHFIRGKVNEIPVLETSWAYDFVTESQHIEVLVKVPDTLDMYEARLYLMANPEANMGTMLNDVPLAWEHGLYGERDGLFGGYNLESKEYRGVAYASCEFYGQDMFINFTSPYPGKSLYHLVFIGEAGSGTIKFLVKTEFGNACLKPSNIPENVCPNNETVIAYTSNSTDLENATLQYSINNWKNTTTLNMEIVDNRTCKGTIPGMTAGTIVNYKVEAHDISGNILFAYGNYSVKYSPTMNLSAISEVTYLGGNITVRGYLTPPAGNLSITVYFTGENASKQVRCYTLPNGTFTASFKPEDTGTWQCYARFNGDNLRLETVSPKIRVRVDELPLWKKYGLYIGGGIAGILIVGILIYVKKSRG